MSWFEIIISATSIIGILGYTAAVALMIYLIINDKKRRQKLEQIKPEETFDNDIAKVQLSKDFLEFVKEMCASVVTRNWRNFADGHYLEKTHMDKIKNEVVKTSAEEVKAALQITNTDMGKYLFSKDYLDKYIIDYAIILTKECVLSSEENNE